MFDIFVSNYNLAFKVLGQNPFINLRVLSLHSTTLAPPCGENEPASVLPSTNAAITYFLSHHLIQFDANADSLLIAVYSSPVGLLLLLHVASFTVCPAQLWFVSILLPSSADSVLNQLQHWYANFFSASCLRLPARVMNNWKSEAKQSVCVCLPRRPHITGRLCASPGPRIWAAGHESQPGSVLGQITVSNGQWKDWR